LGKRIRTREFNQAEYTRHCKYNPCISSSEDQTESDKIIADIRNLFATYNKVPNILMPYQEDIGDSDSSISSTEQGYRS
jgi:hypothetical protein